MQATFVHDGLAIDYTPGADVSAGDVVVQGGMVGIAKLDISSGVLGALALSGVFDVAKAEEAFASVGGKIYWDADGDPYGGEAGSGAATATASGNTLMGFVAKTAESTDSTVRAKLTLSAAAAEVIGLADLSDVGAMSYTAGKILVADGDSVEPVAVSGDATLAADGELTIAEGAVEDSMIEALSDGEILIGVDGTAANNAKVTVSGDAALANDGTLTLAAANLPTTEAIADPGDAGAIAVTNSGSCPIVSEGAETRTLADPTFAGQILNLCFKTDGGAVTITAASPINQTGNNTMLFEDEGDNLVLIGCNDGADIEWRVVANDGVTLSTV